MHVALVKKQGSIIDNRLLRTTFLLLFAIKRLHVAVTMELHCCLLYALCITALWQHLVHQLVEERLDVLAGLCAAFQMLDIIHCRDTVLLLWLNLTLSVKVFLVANQDNLATL